MTEKRKISELTEVTTLNDADELVFVHYEGGSMGPEPTPTPTPTPSPSPTPTPTPIPTPTPSPTPTPTPTPTPIPVISASEFWSTGFSYCLRDRSAGYSTQTLNVLGVTATLYKSYYVRNTAGNNTIARLDQNDDLTWTGYLITRVQNSPDILLKKANVGNISNTGFAGWSIPFWAKNTALDGTFSEITGMGKSQWW